jgi:hypothetical protein
MVLNGFPARGRYEAGELSRQRLHTKLSHRKHLQPSASLHKLHLHPVHFPAHLTPISRLFEPFLSAGSKLRNSVARVLPFQNGVSSFFASQIDASRNRSEWPTQKVGNVIHAQRTLKVVLVTPNCPNSVD